MENIEKISNLTSTDAKLLLQKMISEGGLSISSDNQQNLTGTVLSEALEVLVVNEDLPTLEKQALMVLAMDPLMEDMFLPEIMPQKSKKPVDFGVDFNSVITTTTLAMVVLSTYIHVKRDSDGKWSFEFRIKNSSENLKKELIKLAQKLITLLPEK